jgi:PAS domain S-box-containing protein
MEFSMPGRYLIICIAVIFLMLSSCTPHGQVDHIPVAVNGVMDLRTWDFEKNGSLYLKGDWLFYKDRLIAPDRIEHEKGGLPVQVPGRWNRYDLNGETMPPKGVGTFRLTVSLPEDRAVYALYCEGQGSAYALWLNRRLSMRNGVVADSRHKMVPDKRPVAMFFKPDHSELELLVQVSNFHHRKGGLRNHFMLGLAEPVHQLQMQKWFIQVFSLGMLLVMGFYHLFIFIFRKQNAGPLFFAMICGLWVIRLIVINLNTFLFIQPPMSWETALRIEYITFFIAPAVFCLFSRSLYPKDLHPWFIYLVCGLGGCFFVLALVLDTFLLSQTVTFYQMVMLAQMVYYLYFLNRIIVKRREGAMFIALAFLITFATIIVEALYFQDFLLKGEIAHYGFLAFIFIQAILLATLFSRSFERVERLTGELEQSNQHLSASEKKYRMIFENARDILFVAGPDGKINDISPACEQVLGYTPKEARDMQILDGVVGNILHLRQGNRNIDHGMFVNEAVTVQHKNGRRIKVRVSAALRCDENGKTVEIQGSVGKLSSYADNT